MTRVVAVSGSPRSGSTTTVLLEQILAEFAERAAIEPRLIELHPLAVDLARAVTGGDPSVELTDALQHVAAADVLVVGTPMYRGSYTGLFKQFFDLVGQHDLTGTPVLLTAGGGNDQHTLAIDHELRPLFAFFGALTLPYGVFTRGSDFESGVLGDGARAQIDRALDAASIAVGARSLGSLT